MRTDRAATALFLPLHIFSQVPAGVLDPSASVFLLSSCELNHGTSGEASSQSRRPILQVGDRSLLHVLIGKQIRSYLHCLLLSSMSGEYLVGQNKMTLLSLPPPPLLAADAEIRDDCLSPSEEVEKVKNLAIYFNCCDILRGNRMRKKKKVPRVLFFIFVKLKVWSLAVAAL